MNTRFFSLFLSAFLLSTCIYAQIDYSCLIDYSELKEEVTTGPIKLLPGAKLKLSQTYLADLNNAFFDHENSGMAHYQYLRPASKKELRQGFVESELETLTGKGDIYSLQSTPASVHFFRPDENFDGAFNPTWKDPTMIVPLGLNPVNIQYFANKEFVLKKAQHDYLLFDIDGEYLVFFPGHPEIYEVFDTPELQSKLDERKAKISRWINRRITLKNHHSLLYRLDPYGKDKNFSGYQKEIEIYINDIWVDRRQVLLEYGIDEPLYLVINKRSEFEMFESDCVNHKAKEIVAKRLEQERELDRKIVQLLNDSEAQSKVDSKGQLGKSLQKRFRLINNLPGERSFYEYIGHSYNETPLKPCLKIQVDQQGDILMRSIFVSNKGLYHTKVELHMGDDILESERVSVVDPRSRRSKKQNKIVERIQYKKNGDNGIIAHIARNADKKIMIRYVAGGAFFEEAELSQEDKLAIRDSYLLSLYLKESQIMHSSLGPEDP